MNHEQIIRHSQTAYKQWCEIWRANAHAHKEFQMRSFDELRNTGIGKAVLLVANGYSFEENLETIKKYKDNVDIFACDKTLGHLLDNGIIPKYCIVCDANVSYENYLEKYKDRLKNTILFQNVCGNPKWTKNGNWKKVYFYVNKDVMNYEKEFIEITGCPNIVTAGTNVSNMMVVLLVQADNETRQSAFSYDKILLIGFDYSWREDGKYYAFDKEGGGKFHYMRHIYGLSRSGKILYSSNNLSSSASWLNKYIQAFGPNVIQCSPDAFSMFNSSGILETQMQYKYKPDDSGRVRNLLNEQLGLEEKLAAVNNKLRSIGRDHWFASHSM